MPLRVFVGLDEAAWQSNGQGAGRTILRAILICPDATLAGQLQAGLEKAGGTEVIRQVDRYPSPAELGSLLRAAAADVVFVSLSSIEEAVATARGVEAQAPGTQVAAIHDNCESTLLLEVMRAGVREFLYPPFPLPVLREALERIRARMEQRPRQQDGTDLVYTFLPAKAGVGASTIALNFSAALAEVADARVLLVDFDLNSGLIGFLLKLENQYSLVDAAESASRIDDSLWPRLISRSGRLDVIPSGRINVGFRIEPAQIRHLMEYARRNYKAVCADLSGNLEKYSIELMHESKRIFVVATAELPALHLARAKLDFLRAAKLDDHVSVLLNRVSRQCPVSVADVEKLLGVSAYMTLPNDYSGVQKAVSEGKPVGSKTELGRCFRRLAESVISGQEPAGAGKSRFVEYFSLIPAKYSMSPSAKKGG